MNFPSTILAQTSQKTDPKDVEREIQKADLDLLDKINQLAQQLATIQAAIPSTAGFAPLPQTAAGVGQFLLQQPGNSNAWVLPASGTWAYFGFIFNTGAGSITNPPGSAAGIAAGGATVGAASAGNQWMGFCWRIT